jgi:DNA (cytosine-5)-methyltransferase 1
MKLGFVDLFAGMGGISIGLKNTGGFEEIALNDVDSNSWRTYVYNFPGANYLCKDIKDLTAKELLDIANGREISCIAGGPPCQGLSMAGLRKSDDPRNTLFREYLRLVRELRPSVLLMENVPTILHLFGGTIHNEIADTLREMGYEWTADVVNAAQFGLPQTRWRAIFIAFHSRLGIRPVLPEPTHGSSDKPIFNYRKKRYEPPAPCYGPDILGANSFIKRRLNLTTRVDRNGHTPTLPLFDELSPSSLLPLVTVEEAISDLPPLGSGEGQFRVEYPCEPLSEYQRILRDGSDYIYNHVAWRHGPKLIQKIMHVPEGGNKHDIPGDPHRNAFRDVYARLHRHGLARTITCSIHNTGCGRFTHYRDHRSVTVREAARLQGIPDRYVFLGEQNAQEVMVGNAVPPLLTQAIGEHILRLLGKEMVSQISAVYSAATVSKSVSPSLHS